MPSVVFSRSAQTDLVETWSFISEQSFEAADHVMDVIEKEAQTLALQPLMGRQRPELSAGTGAGRHRPRTTCTTCQQRAASL